MSKNIFVLIRKTDLTCENKAAHSGFEAQRRRHQKSKTGVSVGQQKGLMSFKIVLKKDFTQRHRFQEKKYSLVMKLLPLTKLQFYTRIDQYFQTSRIRLKLFSHFPSHRLYCSEFEVAFYPNYLHIVFDTVAVSDENCKWNCRKHFPLPLCVFYSTWIHCESFASSTCIVCITLITQ